VTSLTIPLLLSSNAFLARILANENAETFGSFNSVALVIAVGIGDCLTSTLLTVCSTFSIIEDSLLTFPVTSSAFLVAFVSTME